MSGGMATPPKRGSSTSANNDSLGGPACAFTDRLKNMFFIADRVDADSKKCIPDSEEPDENVFQPFSFDFEDVWDRVSSELREFGDDDEYAELRSEILSANRETTVGPYNFRMSEDDVLSGLFDEDLFSIPPLGDLKELIGSGISQPRRGGDDAGLGDLGPSSFKKHKADTKQVSKKVPARKSNESDTQFVFVQEVSTNRKKVICLRKGQEVPAGYELTTIKGDVPAELPDELALFPADALQEAILGAANTSGKSAPSSPTKTNPRALSKTSAVDKTTPSKRLTSLEDYMKAEKQKEKSPIVFKQRNSNNALKVVSIINKIAGEDNNEIDEAGANSEIVPVRGDAQRNTYAVRVSYPAAKSKHTSSNRNTAGFLIKSPSAPGYPVTGGPSSPSDPLGIEEGTSCLPSPEQPATFLGCKKCGHAFPVCNDNLFRKHLLFQHDLEFFEDDTTVFEESKLWPKDIRRCKKCNIYAINKFTEHQMKCLPFTHVDSAFEICDRAIFEVLKLECGLCPEKYGSRFELKKHINVNHTYLSGRIILDPEFRCARCLKRFDESVALMRHCAICEEMKPRTETILELAKSVTHCDICNKRHPAIEDTLSCYLNRSYRRCTFCLAVFKDKPLFYKHLNKYHNLHTLTPSTFKMDCPICPDKSLDKISHISHHMVTEHLSPMLSVSNQGIPMPAPIQFGVQQKRSATPVSVSGSKKVPDQKVFTTSGKTQASSNPNAPPGIVFNTSRFSLGPTMVSPVTPSPRPSALTLQAGRQLVLLPVLKRQTPANTPPVSANIVRINRTAGANLTTLSNSTTVARHPIAGGPFSIGIRTTGAGGRGMLGSIVRTPVTNRPPQLVRAPVSPPTPTIVSVSSSAPRVNAISSGTITPSIQTSTPGRLIQFGNRTYVLPSNGSVTQGFSVQRPLVRPPLEQITPVMMIPKPSAGSPP
ncbi:unnamed protein product [Orchesella dallaii]|uniref:C2H2-type domain-containing protein n=1 Tax=Orchesella dallaii TaxID=48710 RepID=A0ABP1QBF6_9HEXA